MANCTIRQGYNQSIDNCQALGTSLPSVQIIDVMLYFPYNAWPGTGLRAGTPPADGKTRLVNDGVEKLMLSGAGLVGLIWPGVMI